MAKQQVSPVLRAFIEANADGEFPGDEIPLPPEMIARRKELAELAAKQEAKTLAREQRPAVDGNPLLPNSKFFVLAVMNAAALMLIAYIAVQTKRNTAGPRQTDAKTQQAAKAEINAAIAEANRLKQENLLISRERDQAKDLLMARAEMLDLKSKLASAEQHMERTKVLYAEMLNRELIARDLGYAWPPSSFFLIEETPQQNTRTLRKERVYIHLKQTKGFKYSGVVTTFIEEDRVPPEPASEIFELLHDTDRKPFFSAANAEGVGKGQSTEEPLSDQNGRNIVFLDPMGVHNTEATVVYKGRKFKAILLK